MIFLVQIEHLFELYSKSMAHAKFRLIGISHEDTQLTKSPPLGVLTGWGFYEKKLAGSTLDYLAAVVKESIFIVTGILS
jgi:hypothetical protein